MTVDLLHNKIVRDTLTDAFVASVNASLCPLLEERYGESLLGIQMYEDFLADELLKEGFDLVSGGTDNHLMLVDLRPMGITGKEFEARLDSVHITVNKNAIPNDPEKPFVTSGVRVGTPAVTSRGFGKDEMLLIAKWMKIVATDFEANKAQIKAEVEALCARFPIYE